MTGSRSPAFTPVRTPRRRWWLPIVWLAVVALLVAAAGVVLAAALWGYAWIKLGGASVTALADDEDAVRGTGPPGATTVLVALTTPVDPTVPQQPELASAVAVVQTGTSRDGAAIMLLSTDLPLTPTRSLADVQLERGLDGLVDAVVGYTGIRIDHAVSATTDALPDLVDTRGAVEVCTGSGCQDLTGDALRVVLSQADEVDRVRVVAAVLRSLAAEVDPLSALLSPATTKRTVDIVADTITTNVSLGGNGLLDMADALTAGTELEVVTIPTLRDPSTDEVLILPERAEVVFQHLREGTALPPIETSKDLVPVEDVTVAVLNGAGVEGLASRVQVHLSAEGFTVVGTGNAPPFGRDTTVVTYAPDDDAIRAAAIVLLDALGAGRLEALDQAPRFEGEPVDVLVTAGLDVEDLE